MENPEKLATRRGNREWKIQRNWQYWVHKPQDKDKQKQETIVTRFCIFSTKEIVKYMTAKIGGILA